MGGATRRPRWSGWRAAVAASACGVAAIATGCGASGSIVAVGDPRPSGGSGGAGPGGADVAGGTNDAPSAGIDACSLVTQADLEALGSGFELGDGQPSSDDELADVPSSACSWTLFDPDGSMNWTFTIVVERGTDSAGFEEAAADTFMKTEPEELSGLGDAATYQEDLFMDGPDKKNRIAVLAGRDLVVIDNLDEGRVSRKDLITITRAVLDRLGDA